MAESTLHIVLVTTPDVGVGRDLAREILQARLAACVNIIPGLESHYWWQGNLDRSAEALLLIKTTKKHLKALEKLVSHKHPYDTPEFLAFPATMVAEKYLAWVRDSVKSA